MTSAHSRQSRVSMLAAAGFALAFAAAPAAAAGFLKLGDIKGESTDDRHKGWIDVESWSWGETQTGIAAGQVVAKGARVGEEARASGSGGGAGKVSVHDISVTKSTDKASPKLAEAAAKGKVFSAPAPRGSLTTSVPAGMCRVGARYPRASLDTGMMAYELENIMITYCSAGSSSGGSGGSNMVPMEQLSLNYEKIAATELKR